MDGMFVNSPAMRMYRADLINQAGSNVGIPIEYITPEMRDWFIKRALEYRKRAEEASEFSGPVDEIKLSKWGKDKTEPGMMSGFYTEDPNYTDRMSPAWQLRHILGNTNVTFTPEGGLLTQNEGYDWSSDYDDLSLINLLLQGDWTASAGKLGSMFGTREDSGKTTKKNIKW
jgi:hypothetical protein